MMKPRISLFAEHEREDRCSKIGDPLAGLTLPLAIYSSGSTFGKTRPDIWRKSFKKINFFCSFLALFISGTASGNTGFSNDERLGKLTNQNNQKINITQNLNITNRYKNVNPLKIPALVITTKEDNSYLKYVIENMVNVILQNKIPEENDADFGIGKYSWPKDPKKTAKLSLSYSDENFKFQSIHVGFRRNAVDGPWCHGEISIYPPNFPIGIFKMTLDKDFFSEFIFQKSFVEERRNHSMQKVNIFLYSLSEKYNSDIRVKFVSKLDVSSNLDAYPKSFHAMIIDRVSENCKLSELGDK